MLSRPTPSASRLLPAALLVAVVGLVYARSLGGGFLWDDDLHVTANPTVVGPLGLKEIWTTARANYFPLVLTNFRLQHALWGLDPFGYHVVTVACHALAAVLLWRVLTQLAVEGAWLGAAVWALHPVQVESVAWICELKNTQSAVFFLLAVSLFLSWRREVLRPGGGPAGRWYAGALVAALAAVLSKPSTVMLPVVLGLLAWWYEGRLRRQLVVSLLPFLVLSAAVSGWTIWEQKFNSGAIGPEWSQTPLERVVLAGRAVWFYLGKLLWPADLMFIYPRWTLDATRPGSFVPALAAAGLLASLWWRRDRRHAWFVAAALFVGLLFPVLGFFSVYFFRYAFVADHFQYLASMAPAVVAGAGLARVAPRWRGVAAAVVLTSLGLLSWRQSAMYRTPETLWRETLARNPAALMARLNLADHLARSGRRDEAEAGFRDVLARHPDEPDAHNDLGGLLLGRGRGDEALVHLRRAVELRPGRAEFHNNLGNGWRAAGRPAEALAAYRRAVELKPGYVEARSNLGAQLAEVGQAAEALAELEAVRRLRPDDPDAIHQVGNALRLLGRYEEAASRQREALARRPQFPAAEAGLGQVLIAAGRREEGLGHLRRAVAADPSLAIAHGYLGRALEAEGEREEAAQHLRRAAELAPLSFEARTNWGTFLARQRRSEDALAEFTAAAALAPGVAVARAHRAQALAALERWREAGEEFAAAVRLAPAEASFRAGLAAALVNEGRLEPAVTVLREAIAAFPTEAPLHETLAQVLQALGRRREAFEALERAAELRRRPAK